MDAAAASLTRIEEAMMRSSSPLARALEALGDANQGRGTCLVLEHEDFGEVLIADRFWRRSRDETLRERLRLSLVDLHQEGDFRRMAVLVEPGGGAARLDDGALALTLAAIEVTSALAALAGAAFPAAGGAAAGDRLRPRAMPQRLPQAQPVLQNGARMRDEGVWGI